MVASSVYLSQRLLELFEKIIHASASNKMDLTNIAMVIAPNLFIRLPSRQSAMDDIAMAQKTSHIVKLLIKYRDLLWTVSQLEPVIVVTITWL